MEFYTVGNSKIKITLSKDEALERGIGAESANCDNPEIRRAYRKILEKARECAGFDTGKDKVLIQIYPQSGGGMELFVTKLGIISKEAANMISKSENVAVLSSKRVHYVFSSFEELLAAVRSIPPRSVEESSLYLLDDGSYCLSFCEREHSSTLCKLSVLLEFGKCVPTISCASLFEHARLLREGDAVDALCHI